MRRKGLRIFGAQRVNDVARCFVREQQIGPFRAIQIRREPRVHRRKMIHAKAVERRRGRHDLSQQLAQSRDHVDTAALMREAHKIKGAARLVGAGEMAQAAGELESAGPQGDWSALLPLMTQVETAVQRLSLFVA